MAPKKTVKPEKAPVSANNIQEEKLKALDPTLLLARGYSITMHNGRAVKDASQLPPGAEIETRLAKGTIHSVIKSV